MQHCDLAERVDAAAELLWAALAAGRTVLVCGNGGSAADAQHIAAELVGRFLAERRALPVIALNADTALVTALGNDYGYAGVFVRQVEAHAVRGGVLWAISTSGRSPNVVQAALRARQLGMQVLAMTGQGGGDLAAHADLLLDVPSGHTPLVQQAHQVVYHHLCAELEMRAAGHA